MLNLLNDLTNHENVSKIEKFNNLSNMESIICIRIMSKSINLSMP